MICSSNVLQGEVRPIARQRRSRRADVQKVLLAVKSVGGESAEAWRSALDGLVGRVLRRRDFVMSTAASRAGRASVGRTLRSARSSRGLRCVRHFVYCLPDA